MRPGARAVLTRSAFGIGGSPRKTALRALGLLLATIVLLTATPARATPDPAAIADRIMHALDQIGTRYHRRGTTPENGFDCSGFIGWVFRQAHGIELPRTARDMFASSRVEQVKRDALVAGDLVFFHIGRRGKRIDHVGLYLGDGRFIHAPATGGEVRIDPLDQPYWTKRYAGARRVPASELPAGAQEALSPVMENADAGMHADPEPGIQADAHDITPADDDAGPDEHTEFTATAEAHGG